MKVVVKRDDCISCGACESVCSDVFQLDDEGISSVNEKNLIDADKELVKEAAASCPTSAINVEE